MTNSPFIVDKLSVCNNALIATGNSGVTIEADGSDEWTAVSNYYDRALPLVRSPGPRPSRICDRGAKHH